MTDIVSEKDLKSVESEIVKKINNMLDKMILKYERAGLPDRARAVKVYKEYMNN